MSRLTLASLFLFCASLLLIEVPSGAQVQVYTESFGIGWAAPTWPTWGWDTPLYSQQSSGDWTPECSDVWAIDPFVARSGNTSLRVDGRSIACLPNGAALLLPNNLEEGSISIYFYDDLGGEFALTVSDVDTGSSSTKARFLAKGSDYQTRIGSSGIFQTVGSRSQGWHHLVWTSTDPSFDRLEIALDGQTVASSENSCVGCSLRHLLISSSAGSVWIDDLSVIDDATGPIGNEDTNVGSMKARY